MKTRVNLKPGQKGTKRLVEQYRDALICVYKEGNWKEALEDKYFAGYEFLKARAIIRDGKSNKSQSFSDFIRTPGTTDYNREVLDHYIQALKELCTSGLSDETKAAIIRETFDFYKTVENDTRRWVIYTTPQDRRVELSKAIIWASDNQNQTFPFAEVKTIKTI